VDARISRLIASLPTMLGAPFSVTGTFLQLREDLVELTKLW
jgi:hypothetical protein